MWGYKVVNGMVVPMRTGNLGRYTPTEVPKDSSAEELSNLRAWIAEEKEKRRLLKAIAEAKRSRLAAGW
jgi:hypothetical protein